MESFLPQQDLPLSDHLTFDYKVPFFFFGNTTKFPLTLRNIIRIMQNKALGLGPIQLFSLLNYFLYTRTH